MPEVIRVKVRVKVAGYLPGQVVDVRKGYGEMLVKVGYASRVDNLAEAMSAESSKYGAWEVDPRSAASDVGFPDE